MLLLLCHHVERRPKGNIISAYKMYIIKVGAILCNVSMRRMYRGVVLGNGGSTLFPVTNMLIREIKKSPRPFSLNG